MGSQVWSTAKQFVADNKDTLRSMLSTILSRYVGPASTPLSDLAFSAFGGVLRSEDPLAIDHKYIRSLYSLGPLHHAPRIQNHYMAMMSTRVEAPLLTLADGTAICIVVPDTCVNGGYGVNSQILPTVSVASGSSTLPFAAAPSYAPAGPFNASLSQMSSYAVDSVSIDFINTQSPINVSGRL